MPEIFTSIERFRHAAAEAGLHTIELAVSDAQGHLRGKRIPADRYLAGGHETGVNIAEAIFAFDVQNHLPTNEFVTMATGFLDCHLRPDNTTGRVLTHRPGYGLVFADALNQHGEPHPLSPRNVLANQIERCRAAGLDPVVATELEFYLCTPDWRPVQEHVQYSSLTDTVWLEPVLCDMRHALLGAGIEVEGSNAEYGPGQAEINTGPTDALTAADNAVLFKSIVKQVAVQHGLRATFMAKPWADRSGSGLHLHTSLNQGGANSFADCVSGEPNKLMRNWIGGLLANAGAMMLLATPNSNGPKRIRPYSFAPTHAVWGLDNRTVLARCIVEAGSEANRVEFRAAGADANPYLVIAAVLAAGLHGIENTTDPGPMGEGDLYTSPGDHPRLPADLASAIAAFEGSELAGLLGDTFHRSYVSIARAEVGHAAKHSPDADDVNAWERARFMEHS